LSELLEILDHPIFETGSSGFAELGSTEQIPALYIGQKLDHLVGKSEHPIF
jgi:hypothetical protein